MESMNENIVAELTETATAAATAVQNVAEEAAVAAKDAEVATREKIGGIAEAAAETAEEGVAATEEGMANVQESVEDLIQAASTTEETAPMTDEGQSSVSNEKIIGIAVAAVVVIAVIIAIAKKRGGNRNPNGSKGNGSKGDGAKGDPNLVEIYVGNLSYDMNDAQLRREFERFGVVKTARVITHRTSGKSKGYGFVEMPHRKEALIAIKALDTTDVMGRRIRVNEARANTRPSED